MALTESRPARRSIFPLAWRVRYRLTPWWAKVIVIFVLSRVVSTTLLVVAARMQLANPWTGAHPRYSDYASIWDGRWYNIVAVSGYPSTLPMTADGHVGENAWAFMPGYPVLVRLLMVVTGEQWAPVAVFVSGACALVAALLFHRLMVRVLDQSAALFAVVLFCVAPLSPLLQVAYAESMYLALLTGALLLLVQRRYALLFPVVAVMSLTRPSGLAFALALGLHVVHRWFTRRRDPFPVAERVAAVAITVFSLLMGLLWPALAGVVTGDPTAYTDTELSWRSAYIGYGELVPFTAWFQGGNWWLGAPLGAICVVALVIAFGLVMISPPVRRLGVDLRLWLVSYALYLLAVFFPQSSTFRLLMPMFPLLGAVAQPRSWIYRSAVVMACVALQWCWILVCWWVNGADWTPP